MLSREIVDQLASIRNIKHFESKATQMQRALATACHKYNKKNGVTKSKRV